MFKINNIEISSPTHCSWLLSDLSSESSGRSTRNGRMSKDIIAQKRTLTFQWEHLKWSEASMLMRLSKSSVSVYLTYPDLLTGKNETIECYTGDMGGDYNLWDGENQDVTNITCTFIEM